MLDRIRQRSREESGFTLVELLVVMLILGILAAIAVPSFFSQKDKARDADAKSYARAAETAMETFSVDHDGSYAGALIGDLTLIEPTLNGAALAVTSTASTYTVTVTSDTNNTFSISRLANGTTSLDCTIADPNKPGGCPPSTLKWG